MSSVDFAAAQRRVAARRHARHVAERARCQSQSQSSPTVRALHRRVPTSFTRIWSYLEPRWNTVKGREGTNPAFRVGQVDAELLDEELIDLLRAQVGDALKFFGPHLKDDWAAETLLVLRAILFKLTIWDHDASYGASLQNLKYTDARRPGSTRSPPSFAQKSLYGLLSVGGRYAWTKWEDYLLDIEGNYNEPSSRLQRLSSLSSFASSAYSFAAFASFLVFLLDGRYRTVLDRVLRLRLTSTTAHVTKEVSFEYLNRQLVWHAFTEFLLFLLPLVGINRWKKWMTRAWRKMRLALKHKPEAEDDEDMKTVGELGFLPERVCAICYQDQNPIGAPETDGAIGANAGIAGSSQTDITNPYEASPCGCKYCFVCIAQRIEAEAGDGWTCLRCGETVRQCKPWNGDVMEEKNRRGSGKRVSFVVDEEECAPTRDFEDVEPIPIEEDKTPFTEPDLSSSAGPTLNESTEWAHINGTDSDSSASSEDEDDDPNERGEEEHETDHSDTDAHAYSKPR